MELQVIPETTPKVQRCDWESFSCTETIVSK